MYLKGQQYHLGTCYQCRVSGLTPEQWNHNLYFNSILSLFWRRKQQLTPVFLPGESHGWRSLVGYSPWGHKELQLSDFTFT